MFVEMRIRYEMFKGGVPTGCVVECDLGENEARKKFDELRENVCCGWAEMVAEDENEGEYMDIVDEFEKEDRARVMSKVIEEIFG